MSLHDVSILNHAYKQKHNVTEAKIPNIHLIVLLTVSKRDEEGHLSVPITSMSFTNHNESSQNHARHGHEMKFIAKTFNHNITMVRYNTCVILI